jgi:hypothetical protein
MSTAVGAAADIHRRRVEPVGPQVPRGVDGDGPGEGAAFAPCAVRTRPSCFGVSSVHPARGAGAAASGLGGLFGKK